MADDDQTYTDPLAAAGVPTPADVPDTTPAQAPPPAPEKEENKREGLPDDNKGGLRSYAEAPERGSEGVVDTAKNVLNAGIPEGTPSSAANPRMPLGSEANPRPTRGVMQDYISHTVKDYLGREARWTPEQYQAAAKQVDPKGQMSEGERFLATMAAQKDPDQKVGAMLYGADQADKATALAAEAAHVQDLDKAATLLGHAADFTPKAFGTKYTATRDGLVVNVPGQQNPIVLTPEQAVDAVKSGGLHYDNVMRLGVGEALTKAQQQTAMKQQAGAGGWADSGQQGAAGPQGPGANAPPPEAPERGVGPTREQLLSDSRDADTPVPQAAGDRSPQQLASEQGQWRNVQAPTREQFAAGLQDPKERADFISVNKAQQDRIIENWMGQRYARMMSGPNAGYVEGLAQQPTRNRTDQYAAAANREGPVPNSAGGVDTSTLPGLTPNAARKATPPAQQGAQQFRAQTPAGQANNPRGIGTFIPDQRNPGHGAWTGGERGVQGGGRLTPEEAQQAAQFTQAHPKPEGYAVTPQSGGQPVTSVQTGAKQHSVTHTTENTSKKGSSSRNTSTQTSSEPTYSGIAGAGGEHGGHGGPRELAVDEHGKTAGERTAEAAHDRQTVETEIKDLHARRAAGEQLKPEDQQLLDAHRQLAREIMQRRGGGGQQAQQAEQLPEGATSKLKEGFVTVFGNGQKWTLQGGKAVQVP